MVIKLITCANHIGALEACCKALSAAFCVNLRARPLLLLSGSTTTTTEVCWSPDAGPGVAVIGRLADLILVGFGSGLGVGVRVRGGKVREGEGEGLPLLRLIRSCALTPGPSAPSWRQTGEGAR